MNENNAEGRERDLRLWSAKKWSMVTPPMRPSPRELAFTERALIGAGLRNGAAALILGATPELRSLALKHGLKTTGCDIDEGFWHAMTLLRTVEGREEFIRSNWLDLPGDRRYDVILGDCALSMLSWEDCQALISKLSTLLNHDGFSIQRLQTANEELSLDSIGPAMDSYRRNDPGISLNLYLVFLAESVRNLTRPEMTNREFFETMIFPHLTPGEIERLRPFLMDRKFTYPRQNDLMALIQPHFMIVGEEMSSGPGIWDTARMVVLKKRA
jgi:hypothetical protein